MSEQPYYGPPATLAEFHTFANKVRKAGGGDLLGALKPSVPASGANCLVARNLNFECSVYAAGAHPDGERRWVMQILDAETRGRIAGALGLETTNQSIILPRAIGRLAFEFDASWKKAIVHERGDEVKIDLTGPYAHLYDQEKINMYLLSSAYRRVTILRK